MAVRSHPGSTTVGQGLAALGGWLLGALVDAVFIAMLPWPRAGLSTRLLHHLHDLGHFLALGLTSAGLALAWNRWGHRRPWPAMLALAAVASGIGAMVLPADLMNFSRSIPGPPQLVMAGLVGAVAMMVPAAALLGRALTRHGLRWAALLASTLGFVANNLVLRGDYKGGHIIFACAAAAIGAAGLLGAPTRLPRRVLTPLLALGSALALFSVATVPPQAVLVHTGLVDGDVLASQLARVREAWLDSLDFDESTIPEPLREWFVDRSGHAPIPASRPSLLPTDPIVIVISVDSIRAELLQDPRYRETAPRLWELVGRSVSFTRAYTPGAATCPVFASVMTGKHQTQLNFSHSKVRQRHLRDDSSEQFVEQLASAGVHSFHAISWKHLQAETNLIRGFDEELFIEPPEGQRFALADATLAPIIERLTERPEGPQYFAAHLMDAHYPFDAAGSDGPAFTRYLGEFALLDAAIGHLWDSAERLGLLDRLVFIFTADHGEGLGKHNTPNHGITLYEELVRVPLAIRIPGVEPRVIDDMVSLLDLGPTLLDLLGLPTPGDYMGQSLVPYLRGASPTLTRPIAGVTENADKRVYFMMLSDREKVIWNRTTGTREIYDLASDPDEELNLYESLGDEGVAHFALLRAFFERHPFFAAQNEIAAAVARANDPSKPKPKRKSPK